MSTLPRLHHSHAAFNPGAAWNSRDDTNREVKIVYVKRWYGGFDEHHFNVTYSCPAEQGNPIQDSDIWNFQTMYSPKEIT